MDRTVKVNNLFFLSCLVSKEDFHIQDLTKNLKIEKFPPTLRVRLTPAGNYMFKVNNRSTRTRCEIYSKLTIKTPTRTTPLASLWCLLLTLNIFQILF